MLDKYQVINIKILLSKTNKYIGLIYISNLRIKLNFLTVRMYVFFSLIHISYINIEDLYSVEISIFDTSNSFEIF